MGDAVAVRAIRGATQLSEDDADEMRESVTELVTLIMQRNKLVADDLISAVFTSTPDLVAAFPATAARGIGLDDVALLCASEIDVAGALPRVVRVMFHADMDVTRGEVNHVYTRGAEVLRLDLAQ
jgi:chorismate mutase